MRRREEKRRKLHEALLQTLYPPSSPPSSPSSSPRFQTEVDDEDESFDVTLINPEDYVKIESSNHGEEIESGEDSETTEKQSRSQRKKLRKKMLKEEAAQRKKVIGPLLPVEMIQTRDAKLADSCCAQRVRQNVQENDEKCSGNDKVKKRRETKKKLSKESSIPIHLQAPTT